MLELENETETASVDVETECVDERRSSFRCPVQGAEEAAILRTRKLDLMVRVVEKSAGGFGAFVPLTASLEVGQVVALAMSSGCCEVEIVHKTEIEGESRLGLKHLRTLECLPPKGFVGRAKQSVNSAAGGNLRWGLMLALCVAFFVFGVTLPSNWWREKLGFRQAGLARAGQTENGEQLSSRSLVNLDGIKARGFYDALELTADQEQKVHKIIEDTTTALVELSKQKGIGPHDVWSDLGLQLLHRSFEKIQAELTEEQRARWMEMAK